VAKTRAAIERLWDVCQVPDYRKISPAAHAELVVTLYGFLMREGTIPADWFSRQVALADRTDGDIDTLSQRIAHIRTWTFAANRPDWLADPDHWQGVTRAVEDKLSDALHERLAERFVDRRTSVLMRRLREKAMLETEITKTGEVVVEGHTIGRLDGFRFAPDATAAGSDAKALSAAAQKALAGEIESRSSRLAHAPDAQFILASGGTIRWMGEVVAKITAGDNVLRPRVRILADEHLNGAAHEAVQTRLDLWTRSHIERLLAPLFVLGAADDITGLARGIAFQIVEALGVLERSKVADEVKSLDQTARANLRKHGVRFGAFHIYLPALLKPAPRALAAELWALKHGGPEVKGLDDLQRLASSGRTSFPVDKEVPRALYRTIGYRVCGERAVRVDILERLADLIRPALAWRDGAAGPKPPGAFDGRGFTVTQAMTSLTGSSGDDFASILRALGYRMEKRPRPPEPAEAHDGAPDTQAQAAAVDSAAAEVPVDGVAASDAPPLASGESEAPPLDTMQPSETDVVAMGVAPVVPQQGLAEQADAEPASEPPAAESSDARPGTADAADDAALAHPDGDQGSDADQAAGVAAAGGQDAAAAAPDAKPAAEDPGLVEVWRPGWSDERRPRRHARGGKREAQHADGNGQAATSAAGTAEGEAQERPRRQGRPGRQERQRDGGERPREGRGDRARGRERPFGERSRDGQRRPGRDEGRVFASSQKAPRDRREKEPDPDSPFAKLAALKAQLEANNKDG
jgi:ATP-dependent RNA helicase SUPV3L1/SUV3